MTQTVKGGMVTLKKNYKNGQRVLNERGELLAVNDTQLSSVLGWIRLNRQRMTWGYTDNGDIIIKVL